MNPPSQFVTCLLTDYEPLSWARVSFVSCWRVYHSFLDLRHSWEAFPTLGLRRVFCQSLLHVDFGIF